MPRHMWCSLCGVVIYPISDPSDDALEWRCDVRVVRTVDNRQEPWKNSYVTGCGYVDGNFTVKAPLDPKPYYGEDKSQLDNHTHEIFGDSMRYWAFPFHNDCWELLRDRVGRDVEPNELAPHLFLYLYNMPIHDHERLMPGHDYGGADQFRFLNHRDWIEYDTAVDSSDASYMVLYPDSGISMNKQNYGKTLEKLAAPFALPAFTFTHQETSGHNNLARLPNEIIVLMLTYLPSADLCSLRLASRPIAQMTSPSQLPPAFWRSRFDPDLDVGFVFADIPDKRRSPRRDVGWRDLYIHARATLLEVRPNPHLKSRERIWKSLEPAARVLRLRLKNQDNMHVDAYAANTSQLLETERHGSWASADAAVPLHKLHPLAKTGLAANCRMLEMKKLPWHSQNHHTIVIKASFVEYNGRKYVCGLSLASMPEGQATTDVVSAGFTTSSDFQEVVVGGEALLERIELALCCTGVLGIRFNFKRRCEDIDFVIGDLSVPLQVGGISKLRASEGRTISGLMLGLDAFKIVSISLLEEATSESDVALTPQHDVHPPTMTSPLPAEVWSPAVPRQSVSWLFQNTQSIQLHDVCMHLNFGGEDGGRLRSLVKITAQLCHYPAVFVGLKFTYDDGVECGSEYRGDHLQRHAIDDTVLEQVFLIDGPEGEAIDQVTVAYSMEVGNIRKITCHTNHNRSIDFGTHGGFKIRDTLSMKKIEAEPNSVFTSFFVKLKMAGVIPSFDGSFKLEDHCQRGFFRNFAAASLPGIPSLQKAPQREVNDHMVPINSAVLASAEKVLQFEGNYFFAAADFTDIRRIRVSVGEKPNSREQRMITGLQLEYYDSKLPVIVGQWEKEFGFFDVAAGDRITGLRIGNVFQSNPFLGPIDSLEFSTASGCEAEFISHDEPPSAWRRLFLEDAYERVTGIVWGSNYKWDHAWPLVEPKPNAPRLILGWYPMDSTPCPSSADTSLEKLIFNGYATHHTGNQIASIEVGFWQYGSSPVCVRCIYKDGPTQAIGETRSCFRPQRADLYDGEVLIGMEVGLQCSGSSDGTENRPRYWWSRLAYLKFTTSKGRTLDFHDRYDDVKRKDKSLDEHEHLCLVQHIPFTAEAAEAAKNKVIREKAEIITETISECLSAGCRSPGPKIMAVNLPLGAKRFVGLWALTNACLDWPYFGPLFEGDIVEAKS